MGSTETSIGLFAFQIANNLSASSVLEGDELFVRCEIPYFLNIPWTPWVVLNRFWAWRFLRFCSDVSYHILKWTMSGNGHSEPKEDIGEGKRVKSTPKRKKFRSFSLGKSCLVVYWSKSTSCIQFCQLKLFSKYFPWSWNICLKVRCSLYDTI